MAEPRVALVHDWLTGMRGGEKVLLELCRLFPSAKIYTLFWKRGSVHAEIQRRVEQTSFLQNLPLIGQAYRYYLPLFPAAVRSLRIQQADLVISSHHAVAKGVPIPDGALHVSYIHTPMRYLWDESESYFRFGSGRWWKRRALGLVAPSLRRFDLWTASNVGWYVANSGNVRERVRRIYGADAEVIHPPADTDFFRPSEKPDGGDYYLSVSSLEPYKRIDLAIRAFNQLGRPLWIAGSGTQRPALRSIAGPHVRFLGRVSDAELLRLYQHCRAVVFPGVEDFGIVPVEALACGKPVVACAKGGTAETLTDGLSGVHFWPQEPSALIEAVHRVEKVAWDPKLLRQQSLQFSRHCFRDRMVEFLRGRVGFTGTFSVQPDDAVRGVGLA